MREYRGLKERKIGGKKLAILATEVSMTMISNSV